MVNFYLQVSFKYLPHWFEAQALLHERQLQYWSEAALDSQVVYTERMTSNVKSLPHPPKNV